MNDTPEIITQKPKKRAVLVGINKYDLPNADLSGCVNDVEDVYDLLVKTYNFEPDNIRVLTDERATKLNIESRMEWLIKESQPGDEAVYYHSGHGSRIRDRNGDELTDQLDELLVTYDHSWDFPLIDDDIGEMFKDLKEEVFLSVLVDTCHSGTMTRTLNNFSGNPHGEIVNIRFLDPPFDIACRSFNRDMKVKVVGARDGNEEDQRHILLSGCKEFQTSKELVFNGNVRGALTYNLTKILRENLEQFDFNYMRNISTVKDYMTALDICYQEILKKWEN